MKNFLHACKSAGEIPEDYKSDNCIVVNSKFAVFPSMKGGVMLSTTYAPKETDVIIKKSPKGILTVLQPLPFLEKINFSFTATLMKQVKAIFLEGGGYVIKKDVEAYEIYYGLDYTAIEVSQFKAGTHCVPSHQDNSDFGDWLNILD